MSNNNAPITDARTEQHNVGQGAGLDIEQRIRQANPRAPEAEIQRLVDEDLERQFGELPENDEFARGLAEARRGRGG